MKSDDPSLRANRESSKPLLVLSMEIGDCEFGRFDKSGPGGILGIFNNACLVTGTRTSVNDLLLLIKFSFQIF